MISKKTQEILKKQHYALVGENKHSAIQICRWTKKSLRGEGVCYKERFYGIESHRCCQMTPCLTCPNSCLHCWRAIEYTTGNKLEGKIDSPKEIVDECIKAQRKLLTGFKIDSKSKKKQLSKANQKLLEEAQEPMQFAISLSGEPTLYPKIGELIKELRKRGKTSFLVTNGMYPKTLQRLVKKQQLPTQLYISVNAPNKKLFDKIARSKINNAWGKLNKSLEIMSKLKNKTRTVFRLNLVRELNMSDDLISEYAQLIKKTNPLFVEIKGYMSVGFARKRLGYDKMPDDKEMQSFAKKLAKQTKLKILDKHEFSRAYVLGKSKKDLKIKKLSWE